MERTIDAGLFRKVPWATALYTHYYRLGNRLDLRVLSVEALSPSTMVVCWVIDPETETDLTHDLRSDLGEFGEVKIGAEPGTTYLKTTAGNIQRIRTRFDNYAVRK
jgi:hypothetical protein